MSRRIKQIACALMFWGACGARAEAGCDGHWLRLLEPNEIPACANLDEWTACLKVVNHEPTSVTFQVKPLPPPQAPPTVTPALEYGPDVVVVVAAEEYPLGALFWVHAYGRSAVDCADVHVGFPFSHEGGQ